jgi:nucleotide-binding universal stress UspA family protein
MPKKILLVVNATAESVNSAKYIGELALAMDSQIIAYNVVDVSIAKHLKVATGVGEAETIVKLQEDGWHYLYDVEDVCKGMGARIVLQQEEGMPEAKVAGAAKRFKADLVVVPHSRAGGYAQSRSERFIVALIERLECPLLVV